MDLSVVDESVRDLIMQNSKKKTFIKILKAISYSNVRLPRIAGFGHLRILTKFPFFPAEENQVQIKKRENLDTHPRKNN